MALTPESSGEQAATGLNKLTPEEWRCFNARMRHIGKSLDSRSSFARG